MGILDKVKALFGGASDNAGGALGGVADKATGALGGVADKAAELGKHAVDAVDGVVDKAADAVDGATGGKFSETIDKVRDKFDGDDEIDLAEKLDVTDGAAAEAADTAAEVLDGEAG